MTASHLALYPLLWPSLFFFFLQVFSSILHSSIFSMNLFILLPKPEILYLPFLHLNDFSLFFMYHLLLLLSHFSRVRLCVTTWTAAYQAPPSMGFARQEYWSGVPSPSLYVSSSYNFFLHGLPEDTLSPLYSHSPYCILCSYILPNMFIQVPVSFCYALL